MIFPFPQENLKLPRATNTCNEPRSPSKALFNRGQNQGGSAAVLKRTLSKYFGRYFEVFQKFTDTSITFINSIFY